MHPIKKLLLISWLCLLASACNKQKTNWQLTLDRKSKSPYGTYIAFSHLQDIFPEAQISTTKQLSKTLNEIINQTGIFPATNNLIIVVVTDFNVSTETFDKIQSYLAMGNQMIICAQQFSEDVLTYANIEHSGNVATSFNMQAQQLQPFHVRFNGQWQTYQFTGANFGGTFQIDNQDLANANIIAYTNDVKQILAIQTGNLVLVSTPLLATNHFLLQHQNKSAWEKLLSFFSIHTSHVIWQSGYVHETENSQNSWAGLMKIPPLQYSFILIIILLLFYTLFESKRKQRIIPLSEIKSNDSLEFVETVGQLYFDKKDHKNLAEKMIQYYLEHLRTTYKVKTNDLHDELALQIAHKTNHTAADMKSFFAYIRYIRNQESITTEDILYLYQQLKKYN